LLTLLLVAGGQQPCLGDHRQVTTAAADYRCTSSSRCDCGVGCRSWAGVRGCLAVWGGLMPWALCGPRLGCCPAGSRAMLSDSTFLGCCGPQAYDYRRLFDYPWHATRCEPQWLFPCPGSRPAMPEEVPSPGAEPKPVPSEPLPVAPDPP
jgi:hypothetical protein